MRAAGRPSSSARSAKPGASDATPRSRDSTSSLPERRDLFRPRRDRVARRVAGGRAAQRRVALCDRRARTRSAASRAPARAVPSTRSKYARRTAGPPLTTASRSGVKTSVATSEPQLLGGAQARRRSARRASPSPSASVTSSSTFASPRDAAQRDPSRLLAEADELRVGARPRREALRADVQRLEQVRLPRAVRRRRRARAPARGRGRAGRTSG